MSKRATDAAWQLYPDYPSMDGGYVTQREQRELVMKGYEQAEKDLGWHSVDESLPPIDEEVIVLTDIITEGSLNIGLGRICFGHIVDKNIAVDYNGWNIPGVKYWMPCPKIPEE